MNSSRSPSPNDSLEIIDGPFATPSSSLIDMDSLHSAINEIDDRENEESPDSHEDVCVKDAVQKAPVSIEKLNEVTDWTLFDRVRDALAVSCMDGGKAS
ncbi:hypothetical protein PFISCL1PPCAC_9306, partial [Pristionchus fissidentatus]